MYDGLCNRCLLEGKGVENGCTGGATACQAGRLDTLSTRNGLGEPLHCALGRLECRRGHLVEKWLFADVTECKWLLHICSNSLPNITRIERGNADPCRQRARRGIASVLVLIWHERADFYGRFMGGFARDRCHCKHRRRSVQCMQILQRFHL
jgi:hypothetical protein